MLEGEDVMKATLLHHINVQITNRDRTREWYCRVLGATVLDRGPALNKRQLQLNIGQAELHFSDVKRVTATHPRVHFALEVEDWDEMLTSLDAQGIEYTRDGGGAFSRTGMGDDPRFARREDSGEYYTYVHDPDGNLIELVHHPMGLVDMRGNPVALTKDPEGLRWRQLPEVEKALGKA